MKRLIALVTLVTLGITVSARAQWIVYDPVNNAQQILARRRGHRQIRRNDQQPGAADPTLTDQLNEFKHYEDLFGDPKSVLPPRFSRSSPTFAKPTRSNAHHARNHRQRKQAMVYNANGLFSSIGTTFTTPNGATVTRRQPTYLPARRRAENDGQLSGRPRPQTRARCVESKSPQPRTLKAATTGRGGSEVDQVFCIGLERRAQQHGLRNQSGHDRRRRAGHRQSQRRATAD